MSGYYKAELIRAPARTGPWKGTGDVELAMLGWVHWHNTALLHGCRRDVPSTEFEDASALPQGPTRPWSGSNSPSLHGTQGAPHPHDDRVRGERRRQHRHPVGDAGDEVAALQGT